MALSFHFVEKSLENQHKASLVGVTIAESVQIHKFP